MDEQEIQEKVTAIVAEQMGVDKGEISRDTNFVNDLNADSLDTVELVMEFEDEFETSIPGRGSCDPMPVVIPIRRYAKAGP